MREFMVFVHTEESPMVAKIKIVRAYSRRGAMKQLRNMGFKRRKF
jgi:hypothetical protein